MADKTKNKLTRKVLTEKFDKQAHDRLVVQMLIEMSANIIAKKNLQSENLF